MTGHNAHIAYLPAILKAKGVEHIVLSPGSRNAPLVQVFTRSFPVGCTSIVDERSAAYFALGIAIKNQKPVVLVSTSGTAVLNYAPAIAEAFYQGVPLIVITADRPPEWLDMQDNQTIHQHGVYGENIKKSFGLPAETHSKDGVWFIERLINEAYNAAISGKKGPVHINVPLREPLYNEIGSIDSPRIISFEDHFKFHLQGRYKESWESASRILLVLGQMPASVDVGKSVSQIIKDKRIAVLAEPISNVKSEHIISQFDCIQQINDHNKATYLPDLVVYVGGQVVSKALKKFLREASVELWYVSPLAGHVDTYQNLGAVIQTSVKEFFKGVAVNSPAQTNVCFRDKWLELQASYLQKLKSFVVECPFCDLNVFEELATYFTPEDVVFTGNSSVIRYFQLFKSNCGELLANRGTSGIDGCLSTSAGVASATKQKVISILGDLSFLYDSNGLWNRNLPKNLKIIIVNNHGGNIFGMIPGPQTLESYNDYFLADHLVDVGKLADAYGVPYYSASTIDELKNSYACFYNSEACAILEIDVAKGANNGIFNKLVSKLRS